MLKTYSIFHLNLMYSSIEKGGQRQVLEKCYHPLLDLVSDLDIKAGIEASALTLEMIRDLDNSWIIKLEKLISSGKVEFVGSGYSQLIGALVPDMINGWNQSIGMEMYKELLGVQPKIALVNEMSYSRGIVKHYIENNYQAIIMEWNNPNRFHSEWNSEWLYHPQIAIGTGSYRIPVIWADSIAFQKFQRYAHGDIESEEYLSYLGSHVSAHKRYFPLYSNDVEIFDFRPGRYKTESSFENGRSEWDRIRKLYEMIKIDQRFELVFPSNLLSDTDNPNSGQNLHLEAPEQPIPVKKQEKYNINRWALTGRGDREINTNCYALLDRLSGREDVTKDQKKGLCWLWSSDFRTHITDRRWDEYIRIQKEFLKTTTGKKQAEVLKQEMTTLQELPYTGTSGSCSRRGRYLQLHNGIITLKVNEKKGMALDQIIFHGICPDPLIGSLEHGYYNNITLGADFYSGHAVIERSGKHKITDLQPAANEILQYDGGFALLSEYTMEDVSIVKQIFLAPQSVSIHNTIRMTERGLEIIHPFHFTILPDAFDVSSLYFATHNGGSEPEYFFPGKSSFQHLGLLSPLISAKYGMGATEGTVLIGDGKKELIFRHDPSVCAMIPAVDYRKSDGDKLFMRLVYSAQEIDETFRTNQEEQIIRARISITARSIT